MANKQSKAYGWTYDKKGNLVEVTAPVRGNGKVVSSHPKTRTGALLGGVGFGGVMGSNIRNSK